jgi:hypothetical protein
LGAQYAAIGMFDRAIATTRRATELSADLPLAHFQLGMLLMTRGELEQAQAAWIALDALHADHPLRVFKGALVHFGRAEYEACATEIRRGLSVCQQESLNEEMRRLLEQAQGAIAADRTREAGAAPDAAVPADPAAGQERRDADQEHVLLAGYRLVTDASLLRSSR